MCVLVCFSLKAEEIFFHKNVRDLRNKKRFHSLDIIGYSPLETLNLPFFSSPQQ